MRRAGFTLVEMIVVLLILGISAAAVLPAIVGRADRSGSAHEQVSRLALAARRLAVSRAVPVRLLVEPDGGWRMLDAGSDTVVTLAEGRLAVSSGVPRVSDRPLMVTFEPSGTVSSDSMPHVDRWIGVPHN